LYGSNCEDCQDVTPYILVDINVLEEPAVCSFMVENINSSDLKFEAAVFIEILLNIYQTTRRHIPEESTPARAIGFMISQLKIKFCC
jgi:hypothetical protein